MAGFTKLFNSILDSTVWSLPGDTRLVWITMLASADMHGVVEASIPGLARRAAVALEACEVALATLLAPDKYSRTPDHEGRRIEAVDGGWRLLNHAKYREKMSPQDIRKKNAERQARYRKRDRNGTSDGSHDMQSQRQTQIQKQIKPKSESAREGVCLVLERAAELTDDARQVFDSVAMNRHVGQTPEVAWTNFTGHYAGQPFASRDAVLGRWQKWVNQQCVYGERDRDKERKREDDAAERRRFAKEGPEKAPPPTREQSKAFADQLAARLRAQRAGGAT